MGGPNGLIFLAPCLKLKFKTTLFSKTFDFDQRLPNLTVILLQIFRGTTSFLTDYPPLLILEYYCLMQVMQIMSRDDEIMVSALAEKKLI